MTVLLTTLDAETLDTEVRDFLLANGVESVEAVAAIGRPHWIRLLANASGFDRDFTNLLANASLTWQSAATADRFRVSVGEMEIGVRSMMVLERLGIETFADAFLRSPAEIELALGSHDGMLAELDRLMVTHGIEWTQTPNRAPTSPA